MLLLLLLLQLKKKQGAFNYIDNITLGLLHTYMQRKKDWKKMHQMLTAYVRVIASLNYFYFHP